MVCAENNLEAFTQVYGKVSIRNRFHFTWPTDYKVTYAWGSAQVGQSAPELLGHPYSQVTFRVGFALAELADRLIGEGKFQH